MSSLVNFKENLKDNMTYSLLDYNNYLHETKNNLENLERGNDTLAKCVLLCGELFANKIKKGMVTEEEVESFEVLLPTEEMFSYNHKDLDLAVKMVKEGNSMALNEYETTFGEANKEEGLKKIA